MPTMTRQHIQTNPHILAAIVTLRKMNWLPSEIQSALRISRPTYFRCLAAIEDRRNEALRDR